MKLIIHNGSRVWGGNEKWLATVAESLIGRGHEVVVSCRAAGPVRDELTRRGVPVSAVRPGGDLDLPRAWRFSRWLRREAPDALLLTSWNRTFWGGWAARRAGVPRVVVRLGLVRPLPRRRVVRHAFARYVDALIVNSDEIRQTWWRSAPWFPAESVHLVLNGITPPAVGASTLRSELGVAPGTRLIGGVGRLSARKGFDLLLDALARLPDDDTRIVVAGTGEAEARLRARAAALGVAGRVHWLGFRRDVANVLAGCDVFALSSRNEGMANAMLEAMAVGTPVVATDIAGVRTALGARDGRPPAGWIVPPDDVDALAEALAAALGLAAGGPAEARARAADARYRIEHWFNVERMVDEVEAVVFGAGGAPGGAPVARRVARAGAR